MITSAFDRLRSLPVVFSLPILAARLNGDRVRAAIYAKRWKDSGLISAAGPKVGVYFNRVVDPDASRTRTLDALKMVFPEATICGETVLHDAGWTTQIPRTTQVIVMDRRTIPSLFEYELHRRPTKWFSEFHSHIRTESFPRLTPFAALVDAWKYDRFKGDRMWRPDPDDLEEDEIDWEQLRALFAEHQVPWPAHYPAIEASVSATAV